MNAEKYINDFLDSKSRAKGTVREYRISLTTAFNKIGIDPAEVEASQIDKYLAGLTPGAAKTARSYLNSFFAWMANEGHIRKNPMKDVKHIQHEPKETEPLSDSDIQAIKTQGCKNERDLLMVNMLLGTGGRQAAILNSKPSDIVGDTIHVTEKRGKEMWLHLQPSLLHQLREYIRQREIEDDDYIFKTNRSDRQGEPISRSSFYTAIRNIGKRAGIENLHPHTFRHTFATIVAERGMTQNDIKAVLGHKEFNTSLIYLHPGRNKEYNNSGEILDTVFDETPPIECVKDT